ncbi:TetR/AcrR family transcriptional regulator [Actinomycetospora straminea]|uniref:TetR/AcrR family transcriptional regulator n=1 Tax=Actinomycetospora straminea TaxID=663607 RepID=A0ABP9EJ82_9PSEU|nr:TetR/AcrR family transcriptional regulator [Actinomycetospora straminea]MDD7933808.1 TetR/AcrR family transcriptional regulator [Actinomycetospora straminea]
MSEQTEQRKAAGRGGRKRDPSRDDAILEATTEVLGEVGYARLTMDMVAARARAGKATMYRRWASKQDLVLDAVERFRGAQVDLAALPDTGSVRGDLVALFRPDTPEQSARRMRDLVGLASVLWHEPTLAEAADAALVGPWAQAHRTVMLRGVERGEVPREADIDTICRVLPTMAAYRSLVERKPFDRDFLLASIDVVIMPALRAARDATAPTSHSGG